MTRPSSTISRKLFIEPKGFSANACPNHTHEFIDLPTRTPQQTHELTDLTPLTHATLNSLVFDAHELIYPHIPPDR